MLVTAISICREICICRIYWKKYTYPQTYPQILRVIHKLSTVYPAFASHFASFLPIIENLSIVFLNFLFSICATENLLVIKL